MMSEFDLVALAANYVLFGALFLWRYLNPERWTRWLVESSTSYFSLYMASTFLVFMLVAIAGNFLAIFVFGIFALVFLFIIWKELGRNNGGLLSILLYISAIVQETYYAYTSPDENAMIILLLWYFFGAFMLLALSKPIGKLIDGLNPALAKKHLESIRKEFGPEAPNTIVLEDGTIHGNLGPYAGRFAAVAFFYTAWMLLKVVVLIFI